ncbi:MAG TPA: DNA internalization-related competence protein ComEC/Rec2, partial [Thioalkalivibrio sp.]|nr:DNA internalization-related competence protein ComEC/Rec2 [Thioalkalivibrio sp.]
LGLSPLLLAHFNHTSLVAPLANLVAVPWVGFLVVPLTLLSAALQLLHPATGLFLAGLADGLMGLIWPWLDWLASVPFARWYGVCPAWALALATIGIALWLLPRGLPGRALAPVLCLPLFWPQAPDLPEGGFRLTLLDVGQGLAAVVQTRHHVLVYDTGPRFPSGFDTGEAVVLPFLRQHGVGRVDRLVISHGDSDHAGGARSLLTRMTVRAVQGRWAEGPEAQCFDHASMACERGQQWRWDGVEFRILHPPPFWGDDNISSCVLQVSGPGGRVLLPGDVEGLGEAVLLSYDREGLQSEVLVLPHHGARQGSSDPFLEAVSPRFALVGSGFQSRFGHPHDEVRERLAQRGIPLRETAVEGAIRVDMLPGEDLHSPPGWRLEVRRYWHGQ